MPPPLGIYAAWYLLNPPKLLLIASLTAAGWCACFFVQTWKLHKERQHSLALTRSLADALQDRAGGVVTGWGLDDKPPSTRRRQRRKILHHI